MPYTKENERLHLKKDKKMETNHKTIPVHYDHDIFHCPFIQTPERDKVQYLYADPVFIRQATPRPKARQRAGENKEMQEEDKFYDCEEEESKVDLHRNRRPHNMADVMANIEDPKEFKRLLKEVANTSQILYRCFKRAYHNARKGNTSPEGVSKKYKVCEKCLRKRRDKQHSRTEEEEKEVKAKPCEATNVCDYPPTETLKSQDEINMEVQQLANVDDDSPKDHKVGEQLCDNDSKHECDQCDCLEKRQQLKEITMDHSSDAGCGKEKGSSVYLNGFEVFKICPSNESAYKGMSFCEKCARLRGEPWEAEPSNNKATEEVGLINAISSIFENIKESKPRKKDDIIRCPKISSNPTDMPVMDASMVKQLSSEFSPAPTETAAKAISLVEYNEEAITSNLSMRATKDEQSNVDPNHCPCLVRRYQPRSQPHPLCAYSQNRQTCPCHRRRLLQHESSKHRSLTRLQRKKHSKRSTSNVHMQPITFTLPINLQIQTRTGEIRFFQTELQMEATAEQRKRKTKSKAKTHEAEPIRTATIAATMTATQAQADRGPQQGLQEETQPPSDVMETSVSQEFFFSCSSSTTSIHDTPQPSFSNKPCEALLEIFEIIKKRMANDENIPSKIVKDLAALDIKECVVRKTATPQWVQTMPQSPIISPELSKALITEIPKTFSSAGNQTETLPQEKTSPMALTIVASSSPPLEESAIAPTMPLVTVSSRSPSLDEFDKASIIRNREDLMYYQGTGCFDLPLTDRPRLPPPEDTLQEVIEDLRRKSKTLEKSSTETITHDRDKSLTEEGPQLGPAMGEENSQLSEKDEGTKETDKLVEEQDSKVSIASIIPQQPTPPTPPPPPPPVLPSTSLAPRMSAVAQTDILSSSAYSHFKRNDMRKEIVDNLEDLMKSPTSSSKYEPEEKQEILRNLHKLFTPKRADGKVAPEESHESVLQDIQLLLNPRQSQKSISSSILDARKRKSKEHFRKSKSTEIILKDIRHVLNPKGGEKPSHRFTRDQREHVLENLHNLLTPQKQKDTAPQGAEARDSVLQDLRFLLDAPKTEDAKYPITPPKPSIKAKSRAEVTYLRSSSEELNAEQSYKLKSQDKPKSPSLKQPTRMAEENENIADTERPHTSRQAPPTPKKPKARVSQKIDEYERKTHKVDNSELISSSSLLAKPNAVMDEVISSVSTSSDTFFINLDDNRSDTMPARPSSTLRQSQYIPGNAGETSSDDNFGKEKELKNMRISKEEIITFNRYSIKFEDQEQKPIQIGSKESKLSNTRPPGIASCATKETSSRKSGQRLSEICDAKGNSAQKSSRIDQADFKPFNRKHKKCKATERNSVIGGGKRNSSKISENLDIESHRKRTVARKESSESESERKSLKSVENIKKDKLEK